MKTLRLLAAAVLAIWALAAAAVPPGPPASLTVYSEQGQPFGLVLDGRALTRPLARQVRVGLLLPGPHWADVSVPSPYGPSLRFRTSLWLRPGLDNGYVLVMRRSGPQLRPLAPGGGPGYGGQYLPGGGAPGQYSAPGQYRGRDDYGYDPAPALPGSAGYPNGAAYPEALAPGASAYPNTPPVPDAYPSGNGSGRPTGPGSYPDGNYPAAPGSGYPNVPGAGYPAASGNDYPAGPGNTYPPTSGSDGYYPDGAGCPAPLSPADFSGLQQEVARQPFDSEKLSIAEQALSQNTVRADELAALVRKLDFDKSRIELAKFGYAHVADPQNFYRVYDALQYPSSIREVQQALGLPSR